MELDYNEIGLKCGLEIHQQLNTNKLFCKCSSLLRQDEPDFEVKRKLHAVAGESGEVDAAVEYQASLNKTYNYQGYSTTCLVELDESPPREINQEALEIALQISLLLNAKILPVTQIMRKTVIDGSNTSGFQRTVLIANDGYIETEKGKVGIWAVILEEDAARIVSKKDNEVTYRLDRLGIPLVEIVTAPDIKTPEQAKEVSLKIGELLRTCNVKRGIGTIRQDVSVSVKGGERIEMKGVQDPKIIVNTINNEIVRQIDLVKKNKSKLEVRRGNKDGTTDFLRPMPGSARMYPETDLPLLKISRNLINEVKKNLSEIKNEKKQLKNMGLENETIKLLSKTGKMHDFTELVKILNNPKLIARILLNFSKEIAGHSKLSVASIDKLLTKDLIINLLEKVRKKKLSEKELKRTLERFVENKDLEEAVKFEKEDSHVLEERIMKIIKEKPGLSEKAYMGLAMKEFRGKADGREVMEIIKKHIS
jgi:Glu-tRNA(Gln) amidotransferase subunit E-like FAD-binding protein|tara:strand:+ start:84 stop:1520 length:1437 start_codon:yes stop_codon:yes gene_type:complete